MAIFVCVYVLRELVKLKSRGRHYFTKSMDSYRNIFIIITTILVLYQADEFKAMARWQYHVASVTCLFIWVEMLFLVGKMPRFGKYVQMFRCTYSASLLGHQYPTFSFSSVSWKMLEFFASYVWLSIGFMMAFIILFSNFKAFQGFPSPFVSGMDSSYILISDWTVPIYTNL